MGRKRGRLTLPWVPHCHLISCLTLTGEDSWVEWDGPGELPTQRFRKLNIEISQGRCRAKHRILVQAAASLQTVCDWEASTLELSPGGGRPGSKLWEGTGRSKTRPLWGRKGQRAVG